MKAYFALFRIRFIANLQYRVAALAGLTTQFVWGAMEILAFTAFYRADSAAFLMAFPQMASYIWMQQAFLALFMSWVWDGSIAASITEGGIAYDLVRPMDLYGRWFCQSAANRLASAALRCLPILLVAFLLPAPWRMSLPPSAAQLGLFLMSMLLAFGVVLAYSMLIYISLFYTLSPTGIRAIASLAAEFLSGMYIPLPFFPEPVREIAELLPFAAMQNMPLRIYSGNIAGLDALRGVALQLFWLAALLLLGRLTLSRALKKVVVQGG